MHDFVGIQNCDESNFDGKGCDEFDVVIVGAGLSGAVLADMYARFLNKKVLVMEMRDHIGGNCYDYVDEETGILMNKYGAHLFHTKHEHVWKYVRRFGDWVPYEHRVVGYVDGKYVPIPVNVATVSLLVNNSIDTPAKMKAWLAGERAKSGVPISGSAQNLTGWNGEQVAIARVGKELYKKIFEDYTLKQVMCVFVCECVCVCQCVCVCVCV